MFRFLEILGPCGGGGGDGGGSGGGDSSNCRPAVIAAEAALVMFRRSEHQAAMEAMNRKKQPAPPHKNAMPSGAWRPKVRSRTPPMHSNVSVVASSITDSAAAKNAHVLKVEHGDEGMHIMRARGRG